MAVTTTLEVLSSDADGRLVQETFTDDATGTVVCVGRRYEPTNPPPLPPDPAVLRAQINKATTVAQLRGALSVALDYVETVLPQ